MSKEREQKILAYMKNEIKTKGYPPTVREICSALNIKSTSTAHKDIASLVKQGFIRKDPSKPRALMIVDDSTPEGRGTDGTGGLHTICKHRIRHRYRQPHSSRRSSCCRSYRCRNSDPGRAEYRRQLPDSHPFSGQWTQLHAGRKRRKHDQRPVSWMETTSWSNSRTVSATEIS